MYDPKEMPLAVNPDKSVAGSTRSGHGAGSRPEGVLDERLARRPSLTEDEIAAMRANYAGNVTLIDEQIGNILSVVEQRGELDNTLIVFSSDHGEMNGDYGLIYKQNFLNGAVRIPLIIRLPVSNGRSAESGSIVTEPVELIDIGATMLEYAGSESPEYRFAHSLKPVVEEAVVGSSDAARASRANTGLRSAALSEIAGEYMLYDGKRKACWNRKGELYLLFDIENDPDEINNLVSTISPTERNELSGLLVNRVAGGQRGRPNIGPS